MQYGYIRVSGREQNIDRQTDAFGRYRLDRAFVDRQSDKDFDRPSYRRMINCLRKGDLVVVKSIDRLGRNYDEILEQWRIITKVKQADIFVIDFSLLDTRSKDCGLTGTFIAELVLQILSYVAQTEREFIQRRQAEGIASAKRNEGRLGRPEVRPLENFLQIVSEYEAQEITLFEALHKCEMSKYTFYRNLRQVKK